MFRRIKLEVIYYLYLLDDIVCDNIYVVCFILIAAMFGLLVWSNMSGA